MSSSIAFPAAHFSAALLGSLFFLKQTSLALALDFALALHYREHLPSILFHGFLIHFLVFYSDANFSVLYFPWYLALAYLIFLQFILFTICSASTKLQDT